MLQWLLNYFQFCDFSPKNGAQTCLGSMLPPVTSFIKLFWHNLHDYWRIPLSFYSDYAANGVSYAEKVL
jgi:hypothetical protein